MSPVGWAGSTCQAAPSLDGKAANRQAPGTVPAALRPVEPAELTPLPRAARAAGAGPDIPRRPRPAAMDARWPYRGECGICGGPDARHRLWDAVDTSGRMDGVKRAASDYGMSVADVRLVMDEFAEARRQHRPLPGRRLHA